MYIQNYTVNTPRGTSKSGHGIHYKYHNEDTAHNKSACTKCSTVRKHKR